MGMRRQSLWRSVMHSLALVFALPLTVAGQALTTLHFFGGADGVAPAGLVRSSGGAWYGVTVFEGFTGDGGTVFRLDPSGGLTTLHRFAGADGERPAGIVEAADGTWYGTTSVGGKYWTEGCNRALGCGTVFRLTSAGVLTTLHRFSGPDGASPNQLVAGRDGNYYGTTQQRKDATGWASTGTVFRITPDGLLTTLHNFSGPDGAGPLAALIEGSDGNFYGTTSRGGSADWGTLFRITPTGALTTLHHFQLSAGFYPQGQLLEASDGSLYGTTTYGGSSNCLGSGCGTVFRFGPDGTLTTVYALAEADGQAPRTGLTAGRDGYLYGTTWYGFGSCLADTSHGCGTLFRLHPAGAFTVLHRLTGADGAHPTSGLVEESDGRFVGTTANGGVGTCPTTSGCGTVFRLTMTPPNLRVTTIKAPAAVASGAAFAVTDTTKNDGPGRADPSHTAIWLSTNKTLGGDTLLPPTRAVPALAAGASSTGARSVTLPTVAPGLYYLIAQADADGEVAETSEADNLKVKTLTVGPDLLATMTLTPPVPTSTAPTTIAVTTKNNGGDTALASVTRLYRSSDARIGVGDVLLGEWPVPALAPKGTIVNSLTVTLPAGTYYLIAQVDAAATVVEARETNNLKKLKKTVPLRIPRTVTRGAAIGRLVALRRHPPGGSAPLGVQ